MTCDDDVRTEGSHDTESIPFDKGSPLSSSSSSSSTASLREVTRGFRCVSFNPNEAVWKLVAEGDLEVDLAGTKAIAAGNKPLLPVAAIEKRTLCTNFMMKVSKGPIPVGC